VAVDKKIESNGEVLVCRGAGRVVMTLSHDDPAKSLYWSIEPKMMNWQNVRRWAKQKKGSSLF